MIDVLYKSAMGSLMYLATSTRPDLAAIVNELSKFSQNPGAHCSTLEHIGRGWSECYDIWVARWVRVHSIRGELKIWTRWGQRDIQGVKWFLSARVVVRWRSSMIKLVTHSTCVSEYVGFSEARYEAVYLNQGEMKIGKSSVLLLGDNKSSSKVAMNHVIHQRSTHIRIKYHSLQDRVEEGRLNCSKSITA